MTRGTCTYCGRIYLLVPDAISCKGCGAPLPLVSFEPFLWETWDTAYSTQVRLNPTTVDTALPRAHAVRRLLLGLT